MNFFDILSLLGGLAMFLYGMRLMGDSLKENSSGALKKVMEKVTDNPIKAFGLGIAVTALIQSSTATIVITSGLVGAGIITLHQSLGIIIGANVGTTASVARKIAAAKKRRAFMTGPPPKDPRQKVLQAACG